MSRPPSPSRHRARRGALLCAALAPVQAGPSAADDPPPSRALSLAVTAAPRLAGTAGSLRAVETVSRVLEEAGWQVSVDAREVLLSLPRRIEVGIHEDGASPRPFRERIERFDPDAIPPGDLPPFNAWSASGEVRAEVVDAGHGLRADFERLREARVDLAGKVALCRYGRGYRGIKVELAEEYGCAGVLLFTPPEDNGAARGPTWPAGPWMPPHEAERGAVGPLARGPGDPSTPGFPSPAPGTPAGLPRLAGEELAARLPRIPVTPIGAGEAAAILERLAARRVELDDGTRASVRVGPGPVSVRLLVDAPREVRTIRNVIARLDGEESEFALAGNHRDAWVRGAHDAGSGTVTLLRAAQHLGERRRAGWRPRCGLRLAFWDAEESGLIGSTEWGEAHAARLAERCLAYVNCDAVVSGLSLSVSGTPGLEDVLARALGRVDAPAAPGAQPGDGTLLDAWLDGAPGPPRLRLPGSGSDFAVFLHHLGVPVLDLAFHGNGGGQYHTAFDDFPLMDRFLDPGWVGHETAGTLVAELLAALADEGRGAFDDARAASEMGRHAAEAAEWLGEERARELAAAFEALAASAAPARDAAPGLGAPPRFYRALARDEGLEGRPWFKNELWAPDLETGYGSETFPRLRAAAAGAGDGDALEAAVGELLERVNALRSAWDERTAARGALPGRDG